MASDPDLEEVALRLWQMRDDKDCSCEDDPNGICWYHLSEQEQKDELARNVRDALRRARADAVEACANACAKVAHEKSRESDKHHANGGPLGRHMALACCAEMVGANLCAVAIRALAPRDGMQFTSSVSMGSRALGPQIPVPRDEEAPDG